MAQHIMKAYFWSLACLMIGLWVPPAQAGSVSDALVREGRQAMTRQDYDAARRAFEQAIVADPQNAAAFGDLGLVNQRTGAVDRAWRYYHTALEIAPRDVTALSLAGALDVSLDRIDAARQKLGRLHDACGNCAEYIRLKRTVDAYRPKPVTADSGSADAGSAKENSP
jgi:tetratricopeptide (TPR) repeat protein